MKAKNDMQQTHEVICQRSFPVTDSALRMIISSDKP